MNGQRLVARRRWLGAAVVVVLVGCSGGHSVDSRIGGLSSRSDTVQTCRLLAGLKQTGDEIARADAHDPDTFIPKLAAAVNSYTNALDQIAKRLPTDLGRQVQSLRSAVDQHKFADAIEARAPLDDWASQHC